MAGRDYPSFKSAWAAGVWLGLALVVGLVPLSGCAGYRFGNKDLFPQDIHTVAVPMFRSVSFRRNLGERLTEAVVKQIEKTTPYKVVNEGKADSVLSGVIIGEHKTVLVPELSGNARESQVAMTVKVSWVDRHGRALQERIVPLPAELVDVTGTGDVVPEVGQSIATAQQEAIVRIAKQIVGLMENPW
ncbi:MAG: LPS assembly lipoprotein LptE [Planctomycetaceae bacterium]|nr:LPS assembly lipoprotein LptE [Planctomycetaceae bacterium]